MTESKETENTRKRSIKLFIDVILLDRAPYNVSLRSPVIYLKTQKYKLEMHRIVKKGKM